MKWRYQFYLSDQRRDHKNLEDAMNTLGRDGWELIESYTGPSGDRIFVLKLLVEK